MASERTRKKDHRHTVRRLEERLDSLIMQTTSDTMVVDRRSLLATIKWLLRDYLRENDKEIYPLFPTGVVVVPPGCPHVPHPSRPSCHDLTSLRVSVRVWYAMGCCHRIQTETFRKMVDGLQEAGTLSDITDANWVFCDAGAWEISRRGPEGEPTSRSSQRGPAHGGTRYEVHLSDARCYWLYQEGKTVGDDWLFTDAEGYIYVAWIPAELREWIVFQRLLSVYFIIKGVKERRSNDQSQQSKENPWEEAKLRMDDNPKEIVERTTGDKMLPFNNPEEIVEMTKGGEMSPFINPKEMVKRTEGEETLPLDDKGKVTVPKPRCGGNMLTEDTSHDPQSFQTRWQNTPRFGEQVKGQDATLACLQEQVAGFKQRLNIVNNNVQQMHEWVLALQDETQKQFKSYSEQLESDFILFSKQLTSELRQDLQEFVLKNGIISNDLKTTQLETSTYDYQNRRQMTALELLADTCTSDDIANALISDHCEDDVKELTNSALAQSGLSALPTAPSSSTDHIECQTSPALTTPDANSSAESLLSEAPVTSDADFNSSFSSSVPSSLSTTADDPPPTPSPPLPESDTSCASQPQSASSLVSELESFVSTTEDVQSRLMSTHAMARELRSDMLALQVRVKSNQALCLRYLSSYRQ